MVDFKILVNLGLLFILFHCECIVAFKKFTSLESVDNKICLPQDRIFTVSVPSYADNLGLTVCVTHCITNGVCKSIFYNSVDSTCTACSGVYDVTSALDESTGSKYMYYVSNSRSYKESCINPDDYCREPDQECFTDMCICSPGYSYNPRNKTCVDTCISYGTTFQLYPNRRIIGNNVSSRDDVSVMECTNECLSDALCASFEYRSAPDIICNMQYVNIKTTATLFQEFSDVDLYVRDCA